MTKLIEKIIFKFKKIMKGISYIGYFPKVSDDQLNGFSTWYVGLVPKIRNAKKDSVSIGLLKEL